MLLFPRVLWGSEGAVAILLVQRIIAFFISAPQQNKNRRAFTNRLNNVRRFSDNSTSRCEQPHFDMSNWPSGRYYSKEIIISARLHGRRQMWNHGRCICPFFWLTVFAISVLFTPPPSSALIPANSASPSPLCQPSIHRMLMAARRLYCPSDIMPEDWCVGRARLIRAERIQQHHLIYSTSNILPQEPSKPSILSSSTRVWDLLYTLQLQFTQTQEAVTVSPLSSETDCLSKIKIWCFLCINCW